MIIKTCEHVNKECIMAVQLPGGSRTTIMKEVNRGEEKYEISTGNSMKEGGQLCGNR